MKILITLAFLLSSIASFAKGTLIPVIPCSNKHGETATLYGTPELLAEVKDRLKAEVDFTIRGLTLIHENKNITAPFCHTYENVLFTKKDMVMQARKVVPNGMPSVVMLILEDPDTVSPSIFTSSEDDGLQTPLKCKY